MAHNNQLLKKEKKEEEKAKAERIESRKPASKFYATNTTPAQEKKFEEAKRKAWS